MADHNKAESVWTDLEAKVFPVVEAKVVAASTAAFLVSLISTGLTTMWFRNGLPAWAPAVITSVVTSGLTYAAGWFAKHTPRPADSSDPGTHQPAPPVG